MDPHTELHDAERRLGSVIAGKYSVRGLIGVGGMGAVYEAVHQFTERSVAIKVLHPHVVTSRNAARLLREAQATSKIQHPGVVEVLDAGQDADGLPYLVMERLKGEDLASAIGRGRVNAEFVVRVVIDLLDVLTAAHAQNFVHRDIKPENVFLEGPLDRRPRVRLLDFGIARDTTGGSTSLTASGAVVGTPWYMSPEQARGKSVDARSDLWSVGALLFDCVAGRPPFVGENYNLVVSAILYEQPPSLAAVCPGLPAELIALVDRALSKDAAQRWQSAAEMREGLVQLVGAGELSRVAVQSSSRGTSITLAPGSDTVSAPPTEPKPAVSAVDTTARLAVAVASADAPARKPPSRPRALSLIGAGCLVALVGAWTALRVERGAPAAHQAGAVTGAARARSQLGERVGRAESQAVRPAPAAITPNTTTPATPATRSQTAASPAPAAVRIGSPATATRGHAVRASGTSPTPAARQTLATSRAPAEESVALRAAPTAVPAPLSSTPAVDAPARRRATDIVRGYE